MKSRAPRKPTLRTHLLRSFHAMRAETRQSLLSGLVIFLIITVATALLLVYKMNRPQITRLFHQDALLLSPTITPACSWSTLQIGETALPYKTTYMSSDGSYNIPLINPARLYRMASIEKNTLFILTRMRLNLALFASLKGGERVTVTFEDCTTAEFILSAPQSGEPTTEMLLHQPPGIIIYIPRSASFPGLLVRGEQAGSPPATYPT
jgi:hypothetical protein